MSIMFQSPVNSSNSIPMCTDIMFVFSLLAFVMPHFHRTPWLYSTALRWLALHSIEPTNESMVHLHLQN